MEKDTQRFEHTCIACEKDFLSTRKYERFCKICQISLTKRQKNAYIRENNICLYCGKKFYKRHKQHKFCCKECAALYQIERFKRISKKSNAQLCWSCAHTNAIDCPWFDIPPRINPNSNTVKTDKGYKITECKNYKPDARHSVLEGDDT